MTLQQLKYVTAIADCGSMNEAAKTLFVSQPSLSGAVKELEEEAGIEIFKRTNKGVLPTPAALFVCGKSVCRAGQAVWHG